MPAERVAKLFVLPEFPETYLRANSTKSLCRKQRFAVLHPTAQRLNKRRESSPFSNKLVLVDSECRLAIGLKRNWVATFDGEFFSKGSEQDASYRDACQKSRASVKVDHDVVLGVPASGQPGYFR